MTIIFIKVVDIESLMLHYKFKDHHTFGNKYMYIAHGAGEDTTPGVNLFQEHESFVNLIICCKSFFH